MLGEALLARGYSAEAIPHLQRAHRLDLLGIALTEEHRTAQAIETLLAALQENPNNPDLLFYLGKACGFLSKKSFDQLVHSNPKSARAHELMAESYLAQQQIENAEREYRTALEVRSDLRGIHLALGLIKLEAGNLDDADVDVANINAPGQIVISGEKAKVEIAIGLAKEHGIPRAMLLNVAGAYHSRLMESAYQELGSVLLQKGHTHEALAELERSNRLRPQMIETLFDLGRASALENRPDAAEKAWLEVVALGGTSDLAASARLQLSQLYRKEGKIAEADRQLERYRELEKGKNPR